MKKTHIIAELGINHNGSAASARRLIDASASAGVWGVKFQYRNLANSYAGGEQQIGDEILQEEIERTYLPVNQILELTGHAKQQGLSVGISFFSPEDLSDFGGGIDEFDFFKVPSVEFTNLPLIEAIESYGVPSLISTGAYDEASIRETIGHLNPELWTLMHCISNYPVSVVNSRLGYIQHLKELWSGDVGYSSHDELWETALLAMQMGVSAIERHITFDKKDDGLDHSSSSTPDEFARLVSFADNLDLVLAGNSARVPNQGELLNLQNLGRSYYAKTDIEKGQAVREESVVLRAPRIGLGQQEALKRFGKPALRHVSAGSVIDRSVFEAADTLSDEVIAFAKAQAFSLPVRFHDFDLITERFPIGRFEFHLSFKDMADPIDIRQFSSDHEYSVHLPDYISPTQLIDPFSSDNAQRAASYEILDRTASFASGLQDLTGRPVPMVGSFSVLNGPLESFFEELSRLIGKYADDGVQLMPQWLPPVAWYFGGAVWLSVMNNLDDVALIEKFDIPICMDVCHLAMGDTVFDFDAADVIDTLRPHIGHVHFADAIGFDGEGVAFGEGDSKNAAAIERTLTLHCVKVIEVWQGHLNQGAGFATALIKLQEMFGENDQH